MQKKTTQITKTSPVASALSALAEFIKNKFSPKELELIKRTVAKNTDDLEFAYFIQICLGTGLNPLLKEIWCYKDNKNNLIMFASRDGFRRKAQENSNFRSLNSIEVKSKDSFEMGTNESGEAFVKHSFSAGDRGLTIGAYAVIQLKNGSRVVEWADMKTYNKGWNTWGTHPDEMIKKVAEVHAIKKMSNIQGIYTEEEFGSVQNGIVTALPSGVQENNLTADEKVEQLSDKQRKEIETLMALKGREMTKLLEHFQKEKITDFTNKEADEVVLLLKAMPDKPQDNAGEAIKPKRTLTTPKAEETTAKPIIKPRKP